MLVDLGRNDLSRVCVPGTVQVARFLEAGALLAHHAPRLGGRGRAARRRDAVRPAARDASRPAPSRARRRCARCRSSPSSRATAAARTRARCCTRCRAARSTRASRSGRSSCTTASRCCRRAPASSPTATRPPSTRSACASSPRSRRRSTWRRRGTMILLIDNYDSFTYNLAHLFGELGAEVVVRRNDEITATRRRRSRRRTSSSRPGPAGPRTRASSEEIVRRLAPARADARRLPRPPGDRRSVFGGEVGPARELVHGKATTSRTTAAALRRPARGLPRRALPLARGDVDPRLPRGVGDRRRRRGDGRAPPRAAGRRRPVPPRVGADAARARAREELPGARRDPGARSRSCSTAATSRARRRARVMDTIMRGRGDARADRRLPRRAAAEGRDGGRDRRLRRGDARARRSPVQPDARRPRRHGRHRRRRRQDVQHLDRRRARRGRGGRRRREARQPRRSRRSSGSADVLEALGFELELPPERIARSIDELGFGFMFAPTHHPAMKHAAPVRRELAARTVFNVLGPLTNPAGARAQVVGVYSPALVPMIADVLAAARRAPRIRRARRRRHRRALARRAEPRLRGRRRRRAPSARSTRSTSASRAATRRSCAAARRRRTPRAIREVFAGGGDGGGASRSC